MIRVYVAGPYSGDTIQTLANIRRGISAAVELIQAGYAPYCPWLDFQYGLRDDLSTEQYQTVSLAFVETCDCMLLLPGWRDSEGAKREVARMSEVGNPVFEDFAVLHQYWCNKQRRADQTA